MNSKHILKKFHQIKLHPELWNLIGKHFLDVIEWAYQDRDFKSYRDPWLRGYNKLIQHIV